MDRLLKHKLRKAVDPRYNSYKVFFVLFLISAVICIFALRHNNQTMIKLRSQVYAADQKGSGVEQSLDKLRGYVYGHMNTNLSSGGNAIKPPIQLKYTYDRLKAAAQAKANDSGLYTEAENYCEAQVSSDAGLLLLKRVACVDDYLSSHGGNQPAAIPPGLYEFDFVSPAWSPDLAGWSLISTIVLAGGTIASWLAHRWRWGTK